MTRSWRNRNTRKEDPTGVLPLRMLSRRSVKRKQSYLHSTLTPSPGSTTPGKPFRYTRLSLLFSTATTIARLAFVCRFSPRTRLTPSVMSTSSLCVCYEISTRAGFFLRLRLKKHKIENRETNDKNNINTCSCVYILFNYS